MKETVTEEKNDLTYLGPVLVSGSVDEQEILKLKAQLYADYKRDVELLDGLLDLLRRRNGKSHSPVSEQVPTLEYLPRPEPERPKKARGILAATREVLDRLPDPFKTVQLIKMLEETYPEQFAGKLKRDSLRGTLKQLSDEGWIKQIAEGTGPRPALYKRLKRTVEEVM
jgi:hypothetical protein